MKNPEGSLTPVQYQIMEAVWSGGEEGASVVEIWQAVRADRSVGRTTVLNLVDRLEKRGWLVCRRENRPNRYSAAVSRETCLRPAGGRVRQRLLQRLGRQARDEPARAPNGFRGRKLSR